MRRRSRMGDIWCTAAIVAAAALFHAAAAAAADIPASNLKLAPDVALAAGYEAPATAYVVANGTRVFANHFYYGSKVTGELERGEHVEALAKVKGYEWLLVGRNGMGIGYVPISMLAPAHLYVP